MKIRQGFVSNSSSSSFVCNACGCAESGWDMYLSEAEMHECTNGHTICDSHIKITKKHYIEFLGKENITTLEEEEETTIDKIDIDILEEMAEDFRYEMPASACPVCNFEYLVREDLLRFIKGKHENTEQEIREWLRSQ